jgi:hypothetical protein
MEWSSIYKVEGGESANRRENRWRVLLLSVLGLRSLGSGRGNAGWSVHWHLPVKGSCPYPNIFE